MTRAQGPVVRLPNGLELCLFDERERAAASFVVREIFSEGSYQRPGFEIGPADTIVDVGANMGVFTLWAAQQAPRGRVFAVEPTRAIELLERSLERNGLRNVTPIRAALGRDGETLELVTYPGFNIINHPVGWRPRRATMLLIRIVYGRHWTAPSLDRAPSISLGRLMDERNIDRIHLLKMDCEGSEYLIFRELSADDLRRIERIAMEFHEYAPDQRHQELVSILERSGFRVEVEKPFLNYRMMGFGALWARRV